MHKVQKKCRTDQPKAIRRIFSENKIGKLQFFVAVYYLNKKAEAIALATASIFSYLSRAYIARCKFLAFPKAPCVYRFPQCRFL